MFCNWQQDRGRYVCQNCGAKRRKQVRRVCPGKSKKRVRRAKPVPLDGNLVSIQTNGPVRTDTEVQVLIANFCEWRECWDGAAEKKKCKYCGCGATETVENLHRRRIKNCPKGHWTEEGLQGYLRNPSEKL